ncbi:alpha/beta hydrolase [Streptomyces sp. AC04842]|uniref:alpha/beta fold hydrolase n=1 Tax=Streptomyces sp. AC04842 TaxID=2775327 RepID=UPI0020C5EFDD|nr:alpha/beta hydrolase [Streptomyces sp. AC04842]
MPVPTSPPVHRLVPAPEGRVHLVEQGSGPLVLLVHGFPEGWYSWRHQLPALAAAGYRAVAVDVRGHGRSSRPADPDAYRVRELVDDAVAVVEALGERTAVVVGHDWGSSVASNAALLRPDVFPADRRPAWLTDAELDVYAGEFERTGMSGALARYRAMDRDWEDLAAYDGAPVTQPSLFIGGELDASTTWMADAIDAFPVTLPGLVSSHILKGCGHWVQQERPEDVNRLLTDWLAALPAAPC